ncbi:MAG TPA: ACP phosphodiesterase [Thermoanaerobaculia bacterium]|jgi:acyl carrier protein phosphodiesterase
MNHLAHLFLARQTPQSLAGNLSGDFVKGPLGARFPPAVRAGIEQHRAVDAFTDSHPAVAAFRRVLTPEHGHYARVITDMFLDHFLACSFDRYAGEPLETFLARAFGAIDPHAQSLPGMLRVLYPRIRDDRWLQSYRDVAAMHDALRNISFRFSRKPRPRLESATRHLVDSRDELEAHFAAFFPEIMAMCGVPSHPRDIEYDAPA